MSICCSNQPLIAETCQSCCDGFGDTSFATTIEFCVLLRDIGGHLLLDSLPLPQLWHSICGLLLVCMRLSTLVRHFSEVLLVYGKNLTALLRRFRETPSPEILEPTTLMCRFSGWPLLECFKL